MLLSNMKKKPLKKITVKKDRSGRITIPKYLIDYTYPLKMSEAVVYDCRSKNTLFLLPADDTKVLHYSNFKNEFPDGKYHYYLSTDNGSFRFHLNSEKDSVLVEKNEKFGSDVIEVRY